MLSFLDFLPAKISPQLAKDYLANHELNHGTIPETEEEKQIIVANLQAIVANRPEQIDEKTIALIKPWAKNDEEIMRILAPCLHPGGVSTKVGDLGTIIVLDKPEVEIDFGLNKKQKIRLCPQQIEILPLNSGEKIKIITDNKIIEAQGGSVGVGIYFEI